MSRNSYFAYLMFLCDIGVCVYPAKETEESDDREETEEDEVVPVVNESYVNLKRKSATARRPETFNVLRENGKLCQEFQRKQVKEKHLSTFVPALLSKCVTLPSSQASRRFRSMLEERKQLPAWQERENILDQLDRCQVLVVSGMTGWVTQSANVTRRGALASVVTASCHVPLQVRQDDADPSVHSGRVAGRPGGARGQRRLHAAAPHLRRLGGPASGAGAGGAPGQLGGLPDPPGEREGKGQFAHGLANRSRGLTAPRFSVRRRPPGCCTAPPACC